MNDYTNRIITGDALAVLKTLPDAFVQCVITSPPYLWLRDYGVDGQIGLEDNPRAYITRLVEVFREVRRVLRDDGTAWVNMGDSYASSGKGGQSEEKRSEHWQPEYPRTNTSHPGVSTNFLNCFQSLMKGQPLIFRNAMAIRIATKSGEVAGNDNGFPYGVFLSLLGIEWITIKQRNNNFCQVFNVLNNECYCRIDCPLLSCRMVNTTNLEIVLDVIDRVSIVISDHNLDTHPILGISRVSSTGTSKEGDSSLSIEEPHKPIPECIRDIKPIGNAITFDTPLKCFPDIYLVDQSVTLRDRLDSATSYSGNFRVTSASPEQFCFSLEGCGVDIRSTLVTHLFTPNSFGSLVHYTELYDKAKRMSNALRPKQELGIPDMLKRALMEDGWICRSTIIWSKPNVMPESVEDRPTKSHEYIFLLSKSSSYYYDADAIREPLAYPDRVYGTTDQHKTLELLRQGNRTTGGLHDGRTTYTNPLGRNKRSVWAVSSQAYPESHFATFPPKLIDPMVLAGTSPKACEHCGSPWERVTESEFFPQQGRDPVKNVKGSIKGLDQSNNWGAYPRGTTIITTAGWQPTCSCTNEGIGKCVILDPFCGAGTTVMVASQLQRDWIGIELNPEYVTIARKRIEILQPRMWEGIA